MRRIIKTILKWVFVFAISFVFGLLFRGNIDSFVEMPIESEALSALESIFAAEQSFYAEYGTYSECLPFQVGYIPPLADENLYTVGFSPKSVSSACGLTKTKSCLDPNLPGGPNCIPSSRVAGDFSIDPVPDKTHSMYFESHFEKGHVKSPQAPTATLSKAEDLPAVAKVSDSRHFKAFAVARLGGINSPMDVWSIDQDNKVTHEADGLPGTKEERRKWAREKAWNEFERQWEEPFWAGCLGVFLFL